MTYKITMILCFSKKNLFRFFTFFGPNSENVVKNIFKSIARIEQEPKQLIYYYSSKKKLELQILLRNSAYAQAMRRGMLDVSKLPCSVIYVSN